jgi:hypothetical protein
MATLRDIRNLNMAGYKVNLGEGQQLGQLLEEATQREGKLKKEENMDVGMEGHWILTSKARKFDFSNVSSNEVCIEEIASALSKICRFNGHCSEFYSVAQHSVLVASRTMGIYQGGVRDFVFRAALLHDAAEAYLGDMVYPLKTMSQFSWYRNLEERVQGLIYERMLGGYPTGKLSDAIKQADLECLHAEAAVLLPGHEDWTFTASGNPPFELTAFLDPVSAQAMFLSAWGRKRR